LPGVKSAAETRQKREGGGVKGRKRREKHCRKKGEKLSKNLARTRPKKA
jgi:hypothetical protein